MCLPKPGPRCSSHAKQHLERTRKLWQADPDDGKKHKELMESSLIYDSTRRGQFQIKREIANLIPEAENEREALYERLFKAEALRKRQLAAYKALKKSSV